ncbi:MAG: hypothetical protein KBE23_20215 [Chloroflexi bacterium]|nr:hypothetical protein [Chloroflexota bacterium]MBP7045089.1 hypothetical protein [Chloroflexota bacterium]
MPLIVESAFRARHEETYCRSVSALPLVASDCRYAFRPIFWPAFPGTSW